MENKRPQGVTTAGIFIVIAGILSIISLLPLMILPNTAIGASLNLSCTGQKFAIAVVYNLLLIAAGVAILKGLNWGRILFFAVWPLR